MNSQSLTKKDIIYIWSYSQNYKANIPTVFCSINQKGKRQRQLKYSYHADCLQMVLPQGLPAPFTLYFLLLPFTLQKNIISNHCNASACSFAGHFSSPVASKRLKCDRPDYMTMSPSSMRSTYKGRVQTENKVTMNEELSVLLGSIFDTYNYQKLTKFR